MTDPRDDRTWRIASNGAGKRCWGVARYGGREWAEDSAGRYRRFAHWRSAQKAADELNRQDPQFSP